MTLECGCPEHYPNEWDGQDIDLSGHCVHSHSIPTFLHMPINYAGHMMRQAASVNALELKERWPGFTLTKTGMLGGEILRLVEDIDSPSRLVKYLPINFNVRCVIHQGTMNTLRNSARVVQQALFDEGKLPKEMYLCHLTCPRCAEDRGGDKILLLRRWQANTTLQARLNNRK